MLSALMAAVAVLALAIPAVKKPKKEPVTENVGIGEVVAHLEAGGRAYRTGWNGKGIWIKMQKPDDNSKMTLPYLYLEYPEGHPAFDHAQFPTGARVPWAPSQTDVLARDWQLG